MGEGFVAMLNQAASGAQRQRMIKPSPASRAAGGPAQRAVSHAFMVPKALRIPSGIPTIDSCMPCSSFSQDVLLVRLGGGQAPLSR